MSSKAPSIPGTKYLTGQQAAHILEKLKVMNVEGQTIKIQTIQTNPQTGAKQIVAIPIQSSTGQNQNVSVSPMKTALRTSAAGPTAASVDSQLLTTTHGRTIKISSPRTVSVAASAAGYSGSVSHVSIVKPTTTVVTTGGVGTVSGGHLSTLHSTATSSSPTVAHLQTLQTVPGVQSLQSVAGGVRHKVTLTPQKLGAIAAQPFPRQSLQLDGATSGVKRAIEIDPLELVDSKRRKTEKGGKGLRHFSMKVCEKVKAKGTTTYNEVADELVAELTDPRCQSPSDPQYDQKNIRRRVYDALNVLMAMNIISKEKKEIRWLGLPTNSLQEATSMESDKVERLERIKAKTKQLQDLILQQIAFKNLVERNREAERNYGAPTPNSAIQLPFIIVGTSKKTVIDCSISNDKMEYLFNFDNTFEIHDDMEVLKKMKMTMGLDSGKIDEENLRRARNMVPKALHTYVDELAKSGVKAYNSLMPKVSTPLGKTNPSTVPWEIGDDDGLEDEDD